MVWLSRLPTQLLRQCQRNQARSFAASAFMRQKPPPKAATNVNYNNSFSFDATPSEEQLNYRRVTANDLEKSTSPPTEVRMLVRDFIEDSLYNPNYGYFPRQATIFTATDPIKMDNLRDSVEFQEEVAKRYETFDTDAEGPGRQVWHTPTELFKVCINAAFVLCMR